MKPYFLVGIFFFIFFNTNAQENVQKKNTVYMELAGSGLLYSVNYDRYLLIDNKMRFSSTIGFWYIPYIEAFTDFSYMIGSVVGFNTLFGTQKHFFELGVNVAYMNMKDTEDNYFHTSYLPIRIGYRYQKDEGGLFLRASLMPIVAIIQDVDAEFLYPVTPHFAVGLGYSF
jgi:hypothetical protein